MIGVAAVAAASTAVAAVRATAVAEIAVVAKPAVAAANGAIAVMVVVAAAVATEAAWKMVNGVAVSQAMCSVKFLWLLVLRPMSPRTPVATLTGQTGFDLRSRSDVC